MTEQTFPLLNNLANDEDPIVAETASLLRDFTTQYNNGEMTQQEYAQLCRDLLDMKRVNELTDDINRQSKIAKIFQQVYEVVGTFGGFLL